MSLSRAMSSIYGEVMATQPTARRLFTVDEYERMAELGILGEDERVELIGGEIVRMAAMNARHAGCVQRADRALQRSLGDNASVRTQLPIVIPDHDEPQHDLAVVLPRDDDYDQSHPTPADTLLVIEVADSSLEYDRRLKRIAILNPMYARGGILEAWLVDLKGEGIERHSDPSPDGYRLVARFGRGDVIRSTSVPDLALEVNDLLGGQRRGSEGSLGVGSSSPPTE